MKKSIIKYITISFFFIVITLSSIFCVDYVSAAYSSSCSSGTWYPDGSNVLRHVINRVYYTNSCTATSCTVSCQSQGGIYKDNVGHTITGKITMSGAASGTASGTHTFKYTSGGTNHTSTYYNLGSAVTRTVTKGTAAKTVNCSSYVYKSSGQTSNGKGKGCTVAVNISVPALAKYTITYNANGGSGAPAAGTKYYGQAYTVSSTKPTKTGYTFSTWRISETGNTVGAGGTISAGSNNNYTLVAQWTANSYSIAFNANGGSGSMSNLAMTYGTAKNLTANAFTRAGYVFVGWATSSTGAKVYNNGQSVNNLATSGTVTLYAVWDQKPTHTVTANANNGSIPETSGWTGTGDTATKVVAEDYSYGTLPTPIRAGYTFMGWYSATSGGTLVTANTIVTSSSPFTLYAQWSVNTPIFNDRTINVAYSTSTITENVTPATNGTGSYSYSKVSGDSEITVSSSGEITIPASTIPGTYQAVIRVSDTGNSETKDATYTINIKSVYQVRFNANGGTGTMENQSFVYDEEKYLTTNTFTKEGYNFSGWNTQTDGTGTWYSSYKKVKNITSINNEVIDLYAQWIKANDEGVTITIEDESATNEDGNYEYGNYENPTISVNVTNGTISGLATKTVEYGTDATFTIESNYNPTIQNISCTDGQTDKASYENGTLTITPATIDTDCTIDFYPKVTDFSYTGDLQSYTVPKEGYYYIELGGAAGGQGFKGAKTSGYIFLEESETLYFYIGEQGHALNDNCQNTSYTFNGGGTPGKTSNTICGIAGGGATDVRLEFGDWDDMSSLISRIMVAGGGAGGSNGSNPSIYTDSAGGTLYGEKSISSSYSAQTGNPGTQINSGAAPTLWSGAVSTGTAGTFGKGGSGGVNASSTTTGGGGGGGAGYYGGSGGSGAGNGVFPGAGGSSYISGYAGVNSISGTVSLNHTNQTKHYSDKYFIGGDMISGQNSGNGYGKIEYVGSKPSRRDTKLDNVRYIKDCTNYNTANNGNHWTEIQAIKDGVNIAKGKTVTGTTAQATDRPYTRIVDGDLTPANWSNASSHANNQCVTVDLGENYDLDEVALWNYFGDQRRYISNDFQVSSDNNTWTNLSSDEVWRETSNGARYNAYIDHINGYLGRGTMMLWYDGYANTGTTRNTTATTWKNLASNSLTGSIMNGTAAGATWGPTSLTLDGTNDYVKIAAMNYAKPTIEAVFRQTGTPSNAEKNIVSNVNIGGYYLFMNSANNVYGGYYIGGGYRVVGGYAITPATIYQYATSYNQTDMKLYRSGNLLATETYAGTIGAPTNSTIMIIGANPAGSAAEGGYFTGNIYSTRIYNGVLSDAQIARNSLYDKQQFNIED